RRNPAKPYELVALPTLFNRSVYVSVSAASPITGIVVIPSAPTVVRSRLRDHVAFITVTSRRCSDRTLCSIRPDFTCRACPRGIRTRAAWLPKSGGGTALDSIIEALCGFAREAMHRPLTRTHLAALKLRLIDGIGCGVGGSRA